MILEMTPITSSTAATAPGKHAPGDIERGPIRRGNGVGETRLNRQPNRMLPSGDADDIFPRQLHHFARTRDRSDLALNSGAAFFGNQRES